MSVGAEVRSGLDHWSAGEWRPAMWHATAALELTAVKRYPTLEPEEAFKQTIRDEVDTFSAMVAPDIDFVASRFPVPVPSDQPDGRPDIADLLYAVHRYLHVDESAMPAGCQVVPHAEGVPLFNIAHGRLWLRATAAIGLLAIAVFAPENQGQSIPKPYFLSWREHSFPVAEWWGRRDDFGAIVAESAIEQYALDFGPAWDAWGSAR